MTNPDIVSFGPVRSIGIRYVGKNDQGQIPLVWSEKFLPRTSELECPDPSLAFGICRCSEEADPGEFEYIASFETTDKAPVPEGMVEHVIPAAQYYRKRVPNLAQIGKAWEEVGAEVAALEGWKPYCGPDGCDCATAASFEYYPSNFTPECELFLYIPVKRTE